MRSPTYPIQSKRFLVLLLLAVIALSSCSRTNEPAPAATSTGQAVEIQPSSTAQAVQATATPAPTMAPDTPTAVPENPAVTATTEPAPQPTIEPTQPAETPVATETTPEASPTTEPATTSTSEEETAAAGENECTNKAIFVADVTIPDGTSFRQGETFEKVWKVKNEGTCVWSSYSLVFYGGEVMDAPFNNPIPDTQPGETAEIRVQMRSPSRGGPHVGDWWFQTDTGENFGLGVPATGLVWVNITVSHVVLDDTLLPVADQSSCAAEENSGYVSQILNLINNARASNGLAPYSLNSSLSNAALVHSRDMACANYVDHIGSDGSTWYDRIQAQGYVYSAANENIYVGNPAFGGTPQGAFDWWMNSQVHRDNILMADLNSVGIGYIFNPDSDYGGYYTTVFTRP